MKKIISYINGNYQIKIYEDGTKIRETLDLEFRPTRPESIDLNISNYCENNCSFCYLNATKEGTHAKLLNDEFLKQLKAGTELAINYAKGHPELEEFLKEMKKRKIIVSMTVNERNYEAGLSLIEKKLVYGLGISVVEAKEEMLEKTKKFENVVFHIINKITKKETFEKLKERKVLVLGFKEKGRAKSGFQTNRELEENLNFLMKNTKILVFDNLGLEQLKIKEKVKVEMWEKHFLGNDGKFSMYYDAVSKKAFKSSLETKGDEVEGKTVKEIFGGLNET